MSETLKIIQAVEVHDGETYTLRKGPIPDDTPQPIIDKLRDHGFLAGPGDDVDDSPAGAPDPTAVATGGAEGEPAKPEGGGGGSELPDNAPDADSTSVADLAAFIDSENLNASQTVALAKGDADLAGKVLEAEQVASGGDGRKTVVEPLRKLAEG